MSVRKSLSLLLMAALLMNAVWMSVSGYSLGAEEATAISAYDCNPTVYNMAGYDMSGGFSAGGIQEDETYYLTNQDMCLMSGSFDVSPNNYTIDLDVKISNAAAGFIFGYNNGQYLMWQLNVNGSEMVDGHMTFRPHQWNPGGSCITSKSIVDAAPDSQKTEWNHMKIVVTNSSHIATYVNGVLIDERDNSLAAFGQIGFRQNGSESANYDNLVITDTDSGSIVYNNDFGYPALTAQQQCDDTYTFADGMTATLGVEPNGNSVGQIVFDQIPEGATSLQGTVGMCDAALNSADYDSGNKVWFSIDGVSSGIVGPFLKYADDTDGTHGYASFDIAIPEGAQQVIIYVSNSNADNMDHITFFDTNFIIDPNASALPDEVLAVNGKIVEAGTAAALYQSGSAIAAARAAYDQLSTEQQAMVTSLFSLTSLEAAYANRGDAFSASITGWSSGSATPWLDSASDEQKEQTRLAVADELKYQYMVNAYNAGLLTGSKSLENYAGFVGVQIESTPNDNVGSPWTTSRHWAFVTVPFTGMAFITNGYFAASGYSYQLPISDSFEYNGKVYQVYWNGVRYYDYVPLSAGNSVAFSSVGYYPGNTGSADATNNTFRYAYANYNQQYKWESKTLGIPSGNAVEIAGYTYQQFEGPQGTAYLINTSDRIAGAVSTSESSVSENQAYVISGDLAAAFSALGSDISTCLAVTGAPLSNASGGTQLFANGALTASGFTADADPDVEEVMAQISAISTPITLDSKAAIENAESGYAALTDTQKAEVSNYAVLQGYRATYDNLYAADAAETLIANIGTVTLNSETAIVTAEAAYAALTQEQKDLVTNYSILTAARAAYDSLSAPADYTAVDQALAAIPADLSLYTADTAAAVTAAANAVDRTKKAAEQSEVDAMAAAIAKAAAGLILKTLEMNITISEGMVTQSGTSSGKYDITWNANVETGQDSTIDGINASGVIFKEYGVYYATSDDVLADYANASADEIRQKVFANGEDISVYTMFGFRLKNVSANAVRAAMFYLEYEYDGHTYIVLSTVDETIAVIAAD